jgi:hypothetical protein
MLVQVECYAGHRGEETPRRLRLGERSVELVEVLDCWLGVDHRYFKIAGRRRRHLHPAPGQHDRALGNEGVRGAES